MPRHADAGKVDVVRKSARKVIRFLPARSHVRSERPRHHAANINSVTTAPFNSRPRERCRPNRFRCFQIDSDVRYHCSNDRKRTWLRDVAVTGGCGMQPANTVADACVANEHIADTHPADEQVPGKQVPDRLHEPHMHGRRLHPLPIRIMHWTNAVAMFIMIGSGWKIYNDEVIFGWLHFPDVVTIGRWAQHGLQWHFFGMWIVVLNGLAYVTYGFATGRFRRMLLPIRWKDLIATISDALHLRLSHEDPTQYNTVQKLLYVGVLCVGVLIVLSG